MKTHKLFHSQVIFPEGLLRAGEEGQNGQYTPLFQECCRDGKEQGDEGKEKEKEEEGCCVEDACCDPVQCCEQQKCD